MRRLVLVALLAWGCGTVTADPKAGAGGSSGGQAAAGAPGTGGELAGRGGTPGTGGEPAMCPDFGDASFAYNVDHACGDAGRCLPGVRPCCYAQCDLNNAQFVGCVHDPRVDGGVVTCYATCGDCP